MNETEQEYLPSQIDKLNTKLCKCRQQLHSKEQAKLPYSIWGSVNLKQHNILDTVSPDADMEVDSPWHNEHGLQWNIFLKTSAPLHLGFLNQNCEWRSSKNTSNAPGRFCLQQIVDRSSTFWKPWPMEKVVKYLHFYFILSWWPTFERTGTLKWRDKSFNVDRNC